MVVAAAQVDTLVPVVLVVFFVPPAALMVQVALEVVVAAAQVDTKVRLVREGLGYLDRGQMVLAEYVVVLLKITAKGGHLGQMEGNHY